MSQEFIEQWIRKGKDIPLVGHPRKHMFILTFSRRVYMSVSASILGYYGTFNNTRI